jgi:integrase
MRPHRPWYRKQTDSWYVEIDGHQHHLGKHPDSAPPPRKGKGGWNAPPEIVAAFHHRMATSTRSLPEAEALQVATVCDLFLDFSQRHNSPDTYRGYKDFLQDFCGAYGTLLARELKPLHVTRWLDDHPGWKGSRRNAVVAVKQAFNWADA